MSKYHSLRGMPDILPEEAKIFHWVEKNAREALRLFGFGEIRTPFLESTEIFTRSIGEDTDIVEKEMYSFSDRGGKNISLRPEGTASVVRACIEHGWASAQETVKLFYMGPMFRGERPQKGRLRQFNQIGAEIIGGSTPYLDVELILSLKKIFENLGIKDFKLQINSLGCREDRKKFKKILAGFISDNNADFCEDCLRRSVKNVLRVLDCKKCRGLVSKGPSVRDSLCDECTDNYKTVKGLLTASGVSYSEEPYLVRGLDYYSGTVFEVIHPNLGAQDAIAAGGRYDSLVKQMGGPDIGATGYAIGIERLLLVLDKVKHPDDKKGVLVVALDEASRTIAFQVANELRLNGIACEMDHSGRSLKGGLRKANREGREKVIIIGEEEVKTGILQIKDMNSSEQKDISIEEAIRELKGSDR